MGAGCFPLEKPGWGHVLTPRADWVPRGVEEAESGRRAVGSHPGGSVLTPPHPLLLQELLPHNFCPAMSPVSAAARVPALVSLFDLNADARVCQGLSLVSHPSEAAPAQALRTSCPGTWERLGRTHEERGRLFRA